MEKTTNFHGRKWLFDAVQEWLCNSNSRVFLLKGSPGVGKSTFAASLAHQVRSIVIGFYMCDFNGRKDPEESARECICTIAFQIATRLPDYRLKLLYEKQLDKEKINKRTADELFEFLITEQLNRLNKIPESTTLCIVIDALDEAGRRGGGNALAELLVKHVGRLPEWLGVLITSRPEPYLEQMLETLPYISVDGQNKHNREDLSSWINQRLPSTLFGKDKQSVIEAILEKSGGTFLYLSLVDKDEKFNLADPISLPDKLDGFFKKTFDRYFPDIDEYSEKVEPFLRLMVAAPGQFPAEIGRQIIGWGQREITLNVIEPMGSLLQEKNGLLVFFHASLRDWLTEPQRSGVHVVSCDGAAELGIFLWEAFDEKIKKPIALDDVLEKQFESKVCFDLETYVESWLPPLAPYTPQWWSVNSLIDLAGWLEKKGRYLLARPLRYRIVEIFNLLPEKSFRLELAEAMEDLANNFMFSLVGSTGKHFFELAIDLQEKVYHIRTSVLGDNHELTLLTLSRVPYGEAGLYRKGIKTLDYIMDRFAFISEPFHCEIQAKYAYYLYELGDSQGAKEVYLDLLNNQNLTNYDKVIVESLLGFINYEIGEIFLSVDASWRALKKLKSIAWKALDAELKCNIEINLALALSQANLHKEAVSIIDGSIANLRLILGDSFDSYWTASRLVVQSIVHLSAGNEYNSRDIAYDSLKLVSLVDESVHYEASVPWMLMAWFDMIDGRISSCLQYLDESVKLRKQTLPDGHWRILLAEENLSFALRQSGDKVAADAIFLDWNLSEFELLSVNQLSEIHIRRILRIVSALIRVLRFKEAMIMIDKAVCFYDNNSCYYQDDEIRQTYHRLTRVRTTIQGLVDV